MSAMAEKAMLVNLRISSWSGIKVDRKVTAEVAQSHKAQVTAGAYHKKLFASNPWIQQFNTVANEARAYHTAVTLPWLDNGQRVLPGKLYFDYMAKLRQIKNDAAEKIDLIVQNYPVSIRQAKKDLGSLYNATDYPTAEELALKFSIDARFMPVPDAKDWRVDLGDAEVAKIKAEVEDTLNGVYENIMDDLWNRLHSRVEKVFERLANPDNVFRNTLIEDTDDLLDLLEKLNINDDSNLNKAIEDARLKLLMHGADVLREDKAVRADTAKKAEEVLANIRTFWPGVTATQQAA